MNRRQLIRLSAKALPLLILSKQAYPNERPSDLELLGKQRPQLIDGKNYNFRKAAANAFVSMQTAAKQDGIGIYSFSSYRGFDRQMRIWNRKYNLYSNTLKSPCQVIAEIVKFSSIPGTSRHHWGTDADLIDSTQKRPVNALNAKHYLNGGVYSKLYNWLKTYASEYGFYESYTNDPNRSGYQFEPWHWSYAPLAVPYLRQWGEIDLHHHIAKPPLVGHEHVTEQFLEEFKQKWGFGLNPILIPK